ncbi:putative WD repeat-containing protein C2A9.03 [Sesamum angolense]|uniref:WD repeat-containing protein C2A9.03 n=1 Tax=Sesamum angolense TaxID=2727404 RepID=A0AAE1W4X6_9LAMI|nr:putative WD repeat-containing protein C2A9.03 [Sesamum angolense]
MRLVMFLQDWIAGFWAYEGKTWLVELWGLKLCGVLVFTGLCLQMMSRQQGNHADDMEEEYEMEGVDDMMDEFHGRDGGGSDSDVNEFDYMNSRNQDTTAAQARGGRDIQGIPWERLNITREKYRQTRLEQYKNYENISQSGEVSEKLRNLVWATSKHDVYLMSHYSVMHWSSLTHTKSEVLNVSGHVAPCEKHPGSLLEGFTQTQVSTLAVKDKLLVAGGFHGELICKNLDRPGVSTVRGLPMMIMLSPMLLRYTRLAVHFVASNNDCGVRDFDLESFQLSKHLPFSWPVNHTSLSPDSRLLLIVGDDPDGILVDFRSGEVIASLRGHSDYSFASAWHPSGLTFATGNQDRTCRIWDMRNLSNSVTALKGNLGAIRSIRYTSDGKFMAMAEPADFVHVFDVESGYKMEQEIDFFGEISGMSFSPDTESLFIGVWDRTYGSLIEFGRRREFSYLDTIV